MQVCHAAELGSCKAVAVHPGFWLLARFWSYFYD